MVTDLKKMIDHVSREKGVEKEVLVQALEEAVKAAAKKTFGPERDIEVHFNDGMGEIEVFEFKDVVSDVENEHLQVSLEEAKELDPDSELGDSLGMKMDMGTFGRIAAQAAKQVIMQRLKEAERDIVYDDFKDRKGEIINGIVQRFDKGAIIVNLGRTEAELPAREQIPRESYRQGDRIRAYILDVRQFSRGPQIILSRTHPNFLSALFETEVPEISEGIVQVVQVTREPGSRTKIAVASKESDVDPVGACVGMKGSRVQAVVQELRGEKIDIVTWNPDPAKFVCNALAPAEIVRVIVDETNQSMEVVVPDDQLSLAIGKRGQNVRLASRLTGWRLDVTSETHYSEALKENYMALIGLEGVGESLAADLFQAGFRSAKDLSEATVDELHAIGGISEEVAGKIIENAGGYIRKKPSSAPEDNDEPGENEVVGEDSEAPLAEEQDPSGTGEKEK